MTLDPASSCSLMPAFVKQHSWASLAFAVFTSALLSRKMNTHSQKTCRTTYVIWVGLKYRRHPLCSPQHVSSHTLNPDQRKRLQTRITNDQDYRLLKSHACVNHILVYLPSLMSLLGSCTGINAMLKSQSQVFLTLENNKYRDHKKITWVKPEVGAVHSSVVTHRKWVSVVMSHFGTEYKWICRFKCKSSRRDGAITQ